jgi:heavy metal sensor kinase
VIRLRLRTRLALWFAASILLILTPCLTGILFLEWRSMRAALDHHLTEDLEVAAEMLVLRGPEVVWRTDSDRDRGYDAGPRRWVEAYAPGGQVVFLRGPARQDAVRAALAAQPIELSGFRTVLTPAGGFLRTLSSERWLGSNRVWVRVARSEDGLRRDLRRLVLLFATGAPLAVVAGALAGYVISGRALAPLTRMADRARSISADHLSERLPVGNTQDELGQLASVFNDTFARLEESFEGLKRFSADASHELRTPLTAIRSVGEVGLREVRDPQAYQEIIGSMLEEADRLTRVVDTLLTLSRWESGRGHPSHENVDLRSLVHDVAGQLSVLAEDRGIKIDVALEGPLVVTADAIMLRQAVQNVLDNAIKYTPEGGRVRISSATDAHEHKLIVDDNGPGVPVDQRQRVLERFYRIEGGHQREAGGTGLGLAIVHRALTANRGRLLIDSNDEGGARVVLALPRSDSASVSL